MKIKTSSSVTSSLRAAAFRIMLARDAYGSLYRFRREIMTLRRLQADPMAVVFMIDPAGRLRTSRSAKPRKTKASMW